MLMLIATMPVAPENHAEFEAIMTELSNAVRANETGVVYYQMGKSETEENTYKIVEVYHDQAAFDTHFGSDWFQAAYPKFGPLMSGEPSLSRLQTVG